MNWETIFCSNRIPFEEYVSEILWNLNQLLSGYMSFFPWLALPQKFPNTEFFLVPYFLVFGLNAEIYSVNLRVQSIYGEIRTRKNFSCSANNLRKSRIILIHCLVLTIFSPKLFSRNCVIYLNNTSSKELFSRILLTWRWKTDTFLIFLGMSDPFIFCVILLHLVVD